MWDEIKRQVIEKVMSEIKNMDWTEIKKNIDIEEYITQPILNKVSDHFKNYFLILTIVFMMLVLLMFLNTYLIFSCLQSLSIK